MCYENQKTQPSPVHCEYDSDDSSTSSSSSSSASSVSESNAYNRIMLRNLMDAIFYLERLKRYFRNQPYIYEAFLNTMHDFKRGIITTMTVVRRVKVLLRTKPELLAQFNRFLPIEYQIVIDY